MDVRPAGAGRCATFARSSPWPARLVSSAPRAGCTWCRRRFPGRSPRWKPGWGAAVCLRAPRGAADGGGRGSSAKPAACWSRATWPWPEPAPPPARPRAPCAWVARSCMQCARTRVARTPPFRRWRTARQAHARGDVRWHRRRLVFWKGPGGVQDDGSVTSVTSSVTRRGDRHRATRRIWMFSAGASPKLQVPGRPPKYQMQAATRPPPADAEPRQS